MPFATAQYSPAAQAVAACGGYSEDRYTNWTRVAEMLLMRGYTPLEAEAIMRSKWTRWAGDSTDKCYGQVTAEDLLRFLDDPRNHCGKAEVAELVEQTPSLLPVEFQ